MSELDFEKRLKATPPECLNCTCDSTDKCFGTCHYFREHHNSLSGAWCSVALALVADEKLFHDTPMATASGVNPLRSQAPVPRDPVAVQLERLAIPEAELDGGEWQAGYNFCLREAGVVMAARQAVVKAAVADMERIQADRKEMLEAALANLEQVQAELPDLRPAVLDAAAEAVDELKVVGRARTCCVEMLDRASRKLRTMKELA